MHRNGFTLLETVIFSAIFVLVMMAVYTTYITTQATFTAELNKIEVQQNAWVGMERMSREIRSAGFDPSDVVTTQSTTPIQVANANDITFIGDVDGDGNTDQVRYSLNENGQIIQESSTWNGVDFPAPTESVVADGVIALAFTYFDASDTVTATLADIRRITIDLRTREARGGRPATFPLATDVRLRNL